MVISTCVYAETKSITNKKNEFGGKTVMTAYAPNDEGYKRGVSKEIVYLDNKDKKIKMELFHTEESISIDGVSKSIMYFGSNGKVVITELYDKNGKPLE